MEFINKIVKFIKRSRISNLGPAKDWKLYQELFGTNQRKVSHETSLSIPAYFRALSILSEQIASLPFSIYELKSDGNVVEAINHPMYSLIKYRPSKKYDWKIYQNTQNIPQIHIKQLGVKSPEIIQTNQN